MSKFDSIAFSGDVGRINPIDKPLEETIVCPELKFNYKAATRPAWSVEQCLTRIKYGRKCTKTCPVIRKLGLVK